MKKSRLLLIVSLFLSAVSMIFAFAYLSTSLEELRYDMDVLYGGPDAVHGLSVGVRTDYSDLLTWTSVVIPENGTSESNCQIFQPLAVPTSNETQNEFTLTNISSADDLFYDEMFYNVLQQMYDKSLVEQIAGTDKGIPYYPVWANLMIGDRKLDLRYGFYNGEMSLSGEPEAGYVQNAVRKLNDYFKIPVLPNDPLRYAKPDSELTGDTFQLQHLGVIANEAYYFTFSTQTVKGNTIDVSQIKNGYGIFRMPFDSDGIADFEELSTVYLLDPTVSVLALTKNLKGDTLLLHTIENEQYVLRTIDLDTMQCVQELALCQWPDASWQNGLEVLTYDDYVVCIVNNGYYVVVEVTDDGSYHSVFACDASHEDFGYAVDLSQCSYAFDGTRLAVAYHLGGRWIPEQHVETCSFFVAVYEASGMSYNAYFTSSLDIAEQKKSTYDHQKICSITDSKDALTVRWE